MQLHHLSGGLVDFVEQRPAWSIIIARCWLSPSTLPNNVQQRSLGHKEDASSGAISGGGSSIGWYFSPNYWLTVLVIAIVSVNLGHFSCTKPLCCSCSVLCQNMQLVLHLVRFLHTAEHSIIKSLTNGLKCVCVCVCPKLPQSGISGVQLMNWVVLVCWSDRDPPSIGSVFAQDACSDQLNRSFSFCLLHVRLQIILATLVLRSSTWRVSWSGVHCDFDGRDFIGNSANWIMNFKTDDGVDTSRFSPAC